MNQKTNLNLQNPGNYPDSAQHPQQHVPPPYPYEFYYPFPYPPMMPGQYPPMMPHPFAPYPHMPHPVMQPLHPAMNPPFPMYKSEVPQPQDINEEDEKGKKRRTNYRRPENAAKLNAAVNALIMQKQDPNAPKDIRSVSKIFNIPYNTLRDNYLRVTTGDVRSVKRQKKDGKDEDGFDDDDGENDEEGEEDEEDYDEEEDEENEEKPPELPKGKKRSSKGKEKEKSDSSERLNDNSESDKKRVKK